MQQRHAALEAGLDPRVAAGGKVDATQLLGRGAGVLVPGLGLDADSGSTEKESERERTEHEDTPEDWSPGGKTTL